MKEHMTLNERLKIEQMLNARHNFSDIAREIGKNRSTISREIGKHTRVFYCHPMASWEKGDCENNHALFISNSGLGGRAVGLCSMLYISIGLLQWPGTVKLKK